MFEWFISLDIDTRIQIIAIISTALVSVISILIALATVIQNNKISKAANRAYIVIYIDYIHVSSIRTKYLIIKNFGNTAGTIDNIKAFDNNNLELSFDSFSNIKNFVLAPGQTITTALTDKSSKDNFNFEIKYSCLNDDYKETYSVNAQYSEKLLIKKSSLSNYSNTENLMIHIAEEHLRSKL